MKKPANFGKTEIKVLRAIAEGRREFDKVPEARAIWKLVAKGHVEATVIEQTVQERRAHTFGRHVTYHAMPAPFIRVSAPKIEKVISTVGLNTFLRSLAQEEAGS
jgi:hypothetical protein